MNRGDSRSAAGVATGGLLGSVTLVVAAACALTALCTIWIWHLRWPAADLWRQYTTLLSLPFPADVLALENGHRPVLPNLVRLFDVWCCGASQGATTVVALVLVAVAVLLLLRATWTEQGIGFAQRAAIVLATMLAVFWLGNSRMLVHTSETLHVHFASVALLLGAACVCRAAEDRPLRWSLYAALCATAATFSFGPGIASFVALLLLAVMARVPWRGVAVVALALVLGLYLYAMPGDDGVRGNITIDPATNLRHALHWLGAPWFTAWLGMVDPVAEPSLRAAVPLQPGGEALVRSAQAIAALVPAYGGWVSSSALVGAFGLVALVVVGIRRLLGRTPLSTLHGMALALALFGAGVAFVIALSRHTLFLAAPGQLFADRYLPWSCLFWLGMAILATRALPLRFGALAGVGALTVALLAFPSHAALGGWSEAFSLATQRGAMALRMGIWDAPVMPWDNEASRAHVEQTVAMLRERNGVLFRDLPDPARIWPLERSDEPDLAVLRVVRRVAEPAAGRGVLAFEGRTPWPQRSGELLVLDAQGRYRGLALLAGRHDWRDLVRPPATDTGIFGYLFESGCDPVFAAVVRGDRAYAIARVAPCAALEP